MAIFCPIVLSLNPAAVANTPDQVNMTVSTEAAQRQPRASLAAWRALSYDRLATEIMQQKHVGTELPCPGTLVGSISEAVQLAERQASEEDGEGKVFVVVTGSLHLVGGVLRQLDRPVE